MSAPCPTCGQRPPVKIERAPKNRASYPPPRPATRPECDAPEQVRALKMTIRARSEALRLTRKEWTDLRAQFAAAPASISHARLTALTLAMWCDEQDLAAAAEQWRACLAEREAMPVSERWDLAALQRWASWVPPSPPVL